VAGGVVGGVVGGVKGTLGVGHRRPLSHHRPPPTR
jgi:hypothetical protein